MFLTNFPPSLLQLFLLFNTRLKFFYLTLREETRPRGSENMVQRKILAH